MHTEAVHNSQELYKIHCKTVGYYKQKRHKLKKVLKNMTLSL